MTSGVEHLDTVVKEYLDFRGFVQTAKQFELESRNDKDKGFRADLIVNTIVHYVMTYDLQKLLDYWAHFDRRVFSRLETTYHTSTRKLYFGLLKYYVVNATMTNKYHFRPDKVTEFFNKKAVDLQSHSEWKDWFALPFIQNPAGNDTFAIYFTRQWQEAFQLSLHNFLSVVFQCLPVPSLLDSRRPTSSKKQENTTRRSFALRGPMDMMDDFYAITQQMQLEDPNQNKPKPSLLAKGMAKVKGQPLQEKQGKKLKPTSTLASTSSVGLQFTSANETSIQSSTAAVNKQRRQLSDIEMRQELLFTKKTTAGLEISGSSVATIHGNVQSNSSNQERGHKKSNRKSRPTSTLLDDKYNFLAGTNSESSEYVLLSEDSYSEHSGSITHGKFSRTGHVIASADVDNVVKIWTRSSGGSHETLATVISKSPVLSLEWLDKSDSLILIGNKPGCVKVYDVNNKKGVHDILISPENSSTKLADLCANSAGTRFVCSSLVSGNSSGLISVWDVNTTALELRFAEEAMQSVEFCLDDNCLIAGSVDGNVRILDSSSGAVIRKWHAHSGKIYSMQISTDGLSCFTMDSDQTVSQWSLDSGKLMQSFSLHAGASGPFEYLVNFDQRKIQTPRDKLFAMDASNTYMLTCLGHGAQLYKIVDGELKRDLSLSLHQAPVVAVDWSVADSSTETCLTADMLGSIKLSSLLAK